jgi:hypothetical protein
VEDPNKLFIEKFVVKVSYCYFIFIKFIINDYYLNFNELIKAILIIITIIIAK